VAARNSVPVQETDPTGEIPDNTNWSETVSAITSDQPAGAPVYVGAVVSGKNNAQLQVTAPLRNGGQTIISYIIEWDTSSTFDSSNYGKLTVPSAQMIPLYTDGPLIYDLSGLTVGYSYWMRVSCVTSIGTGPTTTTLSTVTPAGKPLSPSAVVLTTASIQVTPITQVNVSWTAASGRAGNGGSAITGYMVEWWNLTAIKEIQLVRFMSETFPPNYNDSFIMKFGPAPGESYSTGLLKYNMDPINIREEIMNLGYSGVLSIPSNFVVGDITVRRQLLSGTGYQWSITFNSEQNVGDQVLFAAAPLAVSGETVDVIELQTGRRSGGYSERQILTIIATDTNDTSSIEGWFRLTFNGSSFTSWLPAAATAAQVKRGLEQLSTIRVVDVTRQQTHSASLASNLFAGFAWTITFTGDKGNQPSIYVDSTELVTNSTSISATIYDGDNSRNPSTGSKYSNAFPGELPAGYNYEYVSADTRLLSLNNLNPGTEYYITVSAVNAYGIGPSATSAVATVTPPMQVPQPPTNVSIDVNYGSATTLKVTYDKPVSTGGSDILKYRVEVDVSSEFSNSISNEFYCPAGNFHSAFKIKSAGYSGDPIIGGFFTLKLHYNGYVYYTDYIPYDATASKAEEVGVRVKLTAFTATLTAVNAKTLKPSSDVSELLFVGDRIQFSDQYYSEQIFTVTAVNGSHLITVDQTVSLTVAHPNTTAQSMYRYHGGRGNVQSSKVACSTDITMCGPERRQTSGSIESKLEMLTEAVSLGVSVDRDEPDSTNGVAWRVTFLDPSPADPYNYLLELNTSSLVTASGAEGTVTVTQLVPGEVFTSCTGTRVIPTDKTLSNGQYYYARVFAINSVGYSLGQASASPQKPMVVPGIPTSVMLSVASDTELRVTFNPPDSDGGDTITSYLVEYSLSNDFATVLNTTVTYLSGGPPYFKTIQGLTKGVPVYVRVSAGNSQGYGDAAPSTPSYLNPYEESSGPTNVLLRVTTNTMLTVSFSYPEDDGGDGITGYRIEWDTVQHFNSVSSPPHKGYADVDSSTDSSYTIQYLTEGISYYVRVFARNAAGLGTSTTSTPSYAAPSLQIPGKPHTILAVGSTLSGSIAVSWQRPRIPWHDIPCSGLVTAPNDCPTAVGDGLPSSTGGTSITEYLISYNEVEDFTGYDSGEQTTTVTSYTLQNLTPGRTYYIRVLARNAQGSGYFCSFTEENCIPLYGSDFSVGAHTSVTAIATY